MSRNRVDYECNGCRFIKRVLVYLSVLRPPMLAILAGMIVNAGCYAATYFSQSVTSSWVDISTTGTNVTWATSTSGAAGDDATSPAIPLGFTFNYGGTAYSQIYVGSNGWLFFGSTSTAYTNTTLPQTSVANGVLLPFWDDLYPVTSGTIKYKSLGTAPNRSFVVSYINVPLYANTGQLQTFQLVINENNTFQYNYKTTTTKGNSSTIGYQVSNADYVQYSYNTASVPDGTSILWRPSPLLKNSKTVVVLSDPINGSTNPKFIPGATLEYTLQISNSGLGYVDNNTMALADVIPSNVSLFSGAVSGSAPYTFIDGTPSSALTCTFVSLASTTDCVDFSNNSGSTWVYVPNGSYDSAVTNIRFKPTGTMAGVATAGGANPTFTIKFRGLVK